MPKTPTKRSTERRRNAGQRRDAIGAEAFARELDTKLEAILDESRPLIEVLQQVLRLSRTDEGIEVEWIPNVQFGDQTLAALGSRARDVAIMAETTLEQLAGLLERVARYGELAGDPTAEMPELLVRRVRHVTELAQGLEQALATLRSRQGTLAPSVVQDGMITIPTYQSVWGFVEAIHSAKAGKG